MPLRAAHKTKAPGFAGGYLLEDDDEVKRIAKEESEHITLKLHELIGVFAFGLVEVVLRTPWFTEFALPPLLAIVAIIQYFIGVPSIWSVAP